MFNSYIHEHRRTGPKMYQIFAGFSMFLSGKIYKLYRTNPSFDELHSRSIYLWKKINDLEQSELWHIISLTLIMKKLLSMHNSRSLHRITLSFWKFRLESAIGWKWLISTDYYTSRAAEVRRVATSLPPGTLFFTYKWFGGIAVITLGKHT